MLGNVYEWCQDRYDTNSVAMEFAKDDIIKSGEIIVCEGYTDVIAFFTAGMPRAVATCGTALGEEHFRLMRNFAKRIVLAYDADAAGQSAAASVYQWERQHEVDVAVAKLPPRYTTRTSPLMALLADLAEMVMAGPVAAVATAGSWPSAKAPAISEATAMARRSLDNLAPLPARSQAGCRS